MNWQQLASDSPYRTAVAVREALEQKDLSQAACGIQELIDTLSRSDKRALRSQLVRLMLHVIKWQAQPDKRSRSWRATIRNARREVAGLQEDTPSLLCSVIESMWEDCFLAAKEEAEAEVNQDVAHSGLTWEEVFETHYDLK